jgi:hypothetical protein
MAAETGLRCPMCQPPDPAHATKLDALVLGLIRGHSLSENAEALLRAVFSADGLPISTSEIFDAMYADDPDGGPSLGVMYSDANAAYAELQSALDGTGVGVVRRDRGWRLRLDRGAYVA